MTPRVMRLLLDILKHWIEFTDVDFFQNDVVEFDTILFGDMFYSSEFCDLVYSWLVKIASNGCRMGSSERLFSFLNFLGKSYTNFSNQLQDSEYLLVIPDETFWTSIIIFWTNARLSTRWIIQERYRRNTQAFTLELFTSWRTLTSFETHISAITIALTLQFLDNERTWESCSRRKNLQDMHRTSNGLPLWRNVLRGMQGKNTWYSCGGHGILLNPRTHQSSLIFSRDSSDGMFKKARDSFATTKKTVTLLASGIPGVKIFYSLFRSIFSMIK